MSYKQSFIREFPFVPITALSEDVKVPPFITSLLFPKAATENSGASTSALLITIVPFSKEVPFNDPAAIAIRLLEEYLPDAMVTFASSTAITAA